MFYVSEAYVMFVAILLLVLSPYTALIPGIYSMAGIFTRRYKVFLNPWNIGLLVLFLIALVSGILNKSLLSSLASLMLLMYFCISIVMENTFNSEEKIIRFYLSLLYFSIIPGIIGILQKVLYNRFNIILIKRLLYSTCVLDGRIYSTFSNPNIAGGWFAAMLLIALFFWDRGEIRHRRTIVFFMILYSTNLMLTGSRGAIMGLAAASMVFLVLKKGCRKLVIPGILLAVMLLLAVIPSDGSFLNSFMGHEISTSFGSRYPIWKVSIKMILKKPMLGWGLMGMYEKGTLFFDKLGTVVHAHNMWLSILSALGISGFYVYLVMKSYIVYELAMLKKSKSSLTPLLASIQVLVVVHGLVDFIICVPQTGILFISCSAFISSLSGSLSTAPRFQQLSKWSTSLSSRYRAD